MIYIFSSAGNYANYARFSRPAELALWEKSAILQKIKNNPIQNASKIGSKVFLQYGKQDLVHNVRNTLHKANLISWTARRNSLISKENKKSV